MRSLGHEVGSPDVFLPCFGISHNRRMNGDPLPYRLLRGLWLGLRSAAELLVPRDRLDRWLDNAGFFAWKSRRFRSSRLLSDGSTILHRPDDRKIIEEIFERGSYSRAVIVDGDVVIDVGAHIGVFSLYAARKTPHGRIIAVEPAPPNLELLRENVRRNGLRNVKVLACAVSDRRGEAKLFSVGDHAMYQLETPAADLPFTVAELRTLDDLFEAEGLSVCHLLKVDAEKSELAVLKGGERTLRKTRQVIVEACKDDGLHEKVISFLEGLGFACSVEADSPGGMVLYATRPRAPEAARPAGP